MTIKKRRTKEEVIRDTFLNAKTGFDLLPLLRYTTKENFIMWGDAIRTKESLCCPLEVAVGHMGIFQYVRGLFDVSWNDEIPEQPMTALCDFVDAADIRQSRNPDLRAAILKELGITDNSEVANVN